VSILNLERMGNCAVLTMNRPESLNAITTEMLDLLETHLDSIEGDDSRALILTGTGRGFCPGTDLKEPPKDIKARIDHVHRLLPRLIGEAGAEAMMLSGEPVLDSTAPRA
jgi:enoyl-CoA hydratase/carnithine racemase